MPDPLEPAEVTAALGQEPERIGGRTQWWLRDAPPERHDLARSLGLRPARRVRQMRVPLPLDPRHRPAVEPLDGVRAFRPGTDDAEWLEVNRAAFAEHPDQGQMTKEDLAGRVGEDWFDPQGFLIHTGEDGRIDGFCWTKEHAGSQPPMGEIYVIGVRPDAHGGGLGKQLTVAGLDHLAHRGYRVGMLYVEADNAPALRLYERLGFTLHHEDVAYE
jgi:mycothiol synthase